MLNQRVKKTLSFQIIYSYTSSDSELFRMFSLFEYQQLQEKTPANPVDLKCQYSPVTVGACL